MPLIAAAGMQYLDSCQHRLASARWASMCRSLGGLLLFVFLACSRCGSWLCIESACSICCVCDMAKIPRGSAAWAGK